MHDSSQFFANDASGAVFVDRTVKIDNEILFTILLLVCFARVVEEKRHMTGVDKHFRMFKHCPSNFQIVMVHFLGSGGPIPCK